MKSLNRTILLLLFAIVAMGWTTHESLAAEEEPPSIIPINDLASEIGNNSNDFNLFSTQYIMSGYSFIELLTSSTLKVSGNTKAYTPVNTIKVDLYLQQWNSSKSQWVDVLAIGPATNYSSDFISYSKQAKVISGYYYRTKALHHIIHNGTIEQFTSISNQIYAN